MTEILSVSETDILKAGAALASGKLIALPTETVYGLAADAGNDAAVARIFAVKGRPAFNPLIIHVASLDAAQAIGKFDAAALDLARAFWPGPLSLVLERQKSAAISLLASAGLDTIALRIPAHPLARRVIEAAARPLAAPSANPSGKISPTTAAHVLEGLSGRIDAVIDGGPTMVGLESTVIATGGGARILRPGGIPRAAIEAVVGKLNDAESAILSPGQLATHYAPKTRLRLNADAVAADDVLLAFGAAPPPGARMTLNLSTRGDLAEAAANLFAMLRVLDSADASTIAVMPIPEFGLGEAINDRLRRAAHRE